MSGGEFDDEWLGRAGRSDGLAFARLVERHGGRLMALAVRITGDRPLAEDLVQEAFTRAWVQAPRWKPGVGTIGAWLSRVTVNLAIDQARRARPASLETEAEPADPATPADVALIDAERAQRLRRAVADLPPRQRAALALTYDEGLSNAEGAALLGTSVGAFELLLVRARRALRIALTEE